ncbi:MAG: hypothetical protein AVDCRST_MAG48-1301, partial [uncultured Friedmanniella sp.]
AGLRHPGRPGHRRRPPGPHRGGGARRRHPVGLPVRAGASAAPRTGPGGAPRSGSVADPGGTRAAAVSRRLVARRPVRGAGDA